MQKESIQIQKESDNPYLPDDLVDVNEQIQLLNNDLFKVIQESSYDSRIHTKPFV